MKFRSNRPALAVLLAIVCLAAGGMARAQTPAPTPTPGAIAAAKELVLIKGATAMFDPLIPGVIESAKNGFLPTHPQLAQPLNEIAAEMRKQYEPKRNEIIDEVAKIYAQHFTEQELKDLVTFYKSPLGKKMVTEEPFAVDQSLKAAQAWAMHFSDEVIERFQVEMKKKGYNL